MSYNAMSWHVALPFNVKPYVMTMLFSLWKSSHIILVMVLLSSFWRHVALRIVVKSYNDMSWLFVVLHFDVASSYIMLRYGYEYNKKNTFSKHIWDIDLTAQKQIRTENFKRLPTTTSYIPNEKIKHFNITEFNII